MNFLRQLEGGNFEELLANVEGTKRELVEFNKKVPLMVALKQKGICSRHWKEISSHTGLKIDPEKIVNFNFQFILD